MDNFTKNALIGLGIMSVVVVLFFMIASALGSTDINGTDGKVEGQAAESSQKMATDTWGYKLNEFGEYVGFGLAGVFSGFFVGYLWPMIFEEPNVKVKEGNTLG